MLAEDSPTLVDAMLLLQSLHEARFTRRELETTAVLAPTEGAQQDEPLEPIRERKSSSLRRTRKEIYVCASRLLYRFDASWEDIYQLTTLATSIGVADINLITENGADANRMSVSNILRFIIDEPMFAPYYGHLRCQKLRLPPAPVNKRTARSLKLRFNAILDGAGGFRDGLGRCAREVLHVEPKKVSTNARASLERGPSRKSSRARGRRRRALPCKRRQEVKGT